MSLLLGEENSWKTTLYLEGISLHNILSVPLKRQIYIDEVQGTKNIINGIIVRYDMESRKSEYPNGSSVSQTVVINWYIVPQHQIRSWNDAHNQEEKNKLERKIAFDWIKISEITARDRFGQQINI